MVIVDGACWFMVKEEHVTVCSQCGTGEQNISGYRIDACFGLFVGLFLQDAKNQPENDDFYGS